MEMIISKIRALVHTGKHGEWAISTFIVAQGVDLSTMIATCVTQALGIRDSTVIRYARMLGCNGSPDLKLPDDCKVRQRSHQAGDR